MTSHIIHTPRSRLHDQYGVWKSAEGGNCLVAAQKVSFTYECCIYYRMGPHPIQRAIVGTAFQIICSFSGCLYKICSNVNSQEYTAGLSPKLQSKSRKLDL